MTATNKLRAGEPVGTFNAHQFRMPEFRRPKAQYLIVLGATILLGLASRRFPSAFPAVVARYGGDALWAGMVFLLVVLIRPRISTQWAALIALGLSLSVELSQLYHAPWIDAIRATRFGGLALGQGFLWSDLVSYATGVAIMAALDRFLSKA